MRVVPSGPGRCHVYADVGDSIALADHRGVQVGGWVIVPVEREVRLTVPDDGPPVRHYLLKAVRGGSRWWSEPVFFPSLRAGDSVDLELPLAPQAVRVPRPGPTC